MTRQHMMSRIDNNDDHSLMSLVSVVLSVPLYSTLFGSFSLFSLD